MPNPMREHTKQAINLLKEGMSVGQVSAQVGLGRHRVATIKCKYLPELVKRKTDYKLISPVGFVGPCLESMSDEFKEWLDKQTPEGATISQMIVAMAFDTYLTESGKDV